MAAAGWAMAAAARATVEAARATAAVARATAAAGWAGQDRHAAFVVPPAGVAVKLQAVFGSALAVGLASFPVGIRQRRVGRAPHPRALGRSIGAANPHSIATRSSEQQREQQRVLLCGLHSRQLQARRLAGGVGVGPRKGVTHERVGARGRGRRWQRWRRGLWRWRGLRLHGRRRHLDVAVGV
eukprot:scaffold43062_cov49-Phaeocystis_antarctica.AAC.3